MVVESQISINLDSLMDSLVHFVPELAVDIHLHSHYHSNLDNRVSLAILHLKMPLLD